MSDAKKLEEFEGGYLVFRGVTFSPSSFQEGQDYGRAVCSTEDSDDTFDVLISGVVAVKQLKTLDVDDFPVALPIRKSRSANGREYWNLLPDDPDTGLD